MVSKALRKSRSADVRPLTLAHVHLATALSDDAHDARVRNGALDLESSVVGLLEALEVACERERQVSAGLCSPLHRAPRGSLTRLTVHLNLEGKDLETCWCTSHCNLRH